mgnify:CR=1 FL=1
MIYIENVKMRSMDFLNIGLKKTHNSEFAKKEVRVCIIRVFQTFYQTTLELTTLWSLLT